MATTYPSTIDSFTNPSGTSTLDSPDHALQHSDANDAIEAIEAVIGTTAGTSVLKDFSAGEFPARVNSGGTITQTLTGGTINATTLGTPTVTGGSFASPTTTGTDAGTATLTNKTLTSPKLNENVALTSTSTELNNLASFSADTSAISPISLNTTHQTTGLAVSVNPSVSSTIILTLNIVGYMSSAGNVDTYTKINDGSTDYNDDRIYWGATNRNLLSRQFVITGVSSSKTYTAYIRIHTGTDTLNITSASLIAFVFKE